MKVTGEVWLALSREERMICLEYATWENSKRMKKSRQ